MPIRRETGELIIHTSQQADGSFAAELTREQWDEFRRTKWACPVLENGFLVPDVRFQAEDGKQFTALEACMAHESSIKKENAEEEIKQQWREVPNEYRAKFLDPYCAVLASLGVVNPRKVLNDICPCAEPKMPAPIPSLHETAGHSVLESRILLAVVAGSLHVTDLAAVLECDNEAIKAVVKASKFLRWKGPRIALAETSIPA